MSALKDRSSTDHMWLLLGSQFKQTLKSKTLKRQLEIWILTGRLTLNIHLFLCVTTVLSCFKKGLWSFSTHWNIYRWFMMLGIYFKIIWNGGIRLWKEQGIRVQYLWEVIILFLCISKAFLVKCLQKWGEVCIESQTE